MTYRGDSRGEALIDGGTGGVRGGGRGLHRWGGADPSGSVWCAGWVAVPGEEEDLTLQSILNAELRAQPEESGRQKALKFLRSMVPQFPPREWVPAYARLGADPEARHPPASLVRGIWNTLRGDLQGGITAGVMMVPQGTRGSHQTVWMRMCHTVRGSREAGVGWGVCRSVAGMAYALLAGLPPIMGLYSGFLGYFIYALLGTSRQLNYGPIVRLHRPTPGAPESANTNACFMGTRLRSR